MKYYYGEYIKYGQLDNTCGRIVIYGDDIMFSYIRSADHNYLLRALASRYRRDTNKIYGDAIRLYFTHEGDRIVVSPTRKIDDDNFNSRYKHYAKLIKSEIQ